MQQMTTELQSKSLIEELDKSSAERLRAAWRSVGSTDTWIRKRQRVREWRLPDMQAATACEQAGPHADGNEEKTRKSLCSWLSIDGSGGCDRAAAPTHREEWHINLQPAVAACSFTSQTGELPGLQATLRLNTWTFNFLLVFNLFVPCGNRKNSFHLYTG